MFVLLMLLALLVVGLIMYLAAVRPKLQDLGRILFAVALFILLLGLLGHQFPALR